MKIAIVIFTLMFISILSIMTIGFLLYYTNSLKKGILKYERAINNNEIEISDYKRKISSSKKSIEQNKMFYEEQISTLEQEIIKLKNKNKELVEFVSQKKDNKKNIKKTNV